MPNRDHEDLERSVFEDLAADTLGYRLGVPDRHDAGVGLLRVDYVYATAQPNPIALELTRLANENWIESTAAARAVALELSEVSAAESLGYWCVRLVAPVRVKNLRERLIESMRANTPISGGVMSSVSFSRLGAEPHQVAYEYVESSVIRREDFEEALRSTIASNATKLREARDEGFETHLAIWSEVGRHYAKLNLVKTPDNDLRDSIDRVWVIRNVDPSSTTLSDPWAWHARPGDESWVPARSIRSD